MPRKRLLVLPSQGQLLISTDLHGNLEDLQALTQRFESLRRCRDDVHWVILGDLVHGPNEEARQTQPELYGYSDQSYLVVETVDVLLRRYPEHVHFVLGNHDHGHVGGPHPSRFHPDEVEHLERSLTEPQRKLLIELFENALLLVVAPCGVLLSHGSPDESLFDAHQVDALSLCYAKNDRHGQWLLSSLLTSYGQTDAVASAMLASVSRGLGFDLRVVVHGHDRDEAGYFTEGQTQVCPVIFGAPRKAKRYLLIDLTGRYESVEDFREGIEVLRLYDEAGSCGKWGNGIGN
ncbi:MAG TPA: metallophosphoesterase [Polyangiaceae bacterium]|jgi:predicted phosphodiesterase|nr:MAG: Calcineurin-like phosphoesterase [Deltaproteobacteria bacterium ADurb.Bin207]HNS99909.1 metallophosphoesterase [Polyangiaceae bacterium]HNZ25495.1 metallophosphoesterase [Polyangiaceae bacterium]HOD25513.1 metallophosphoesterase [Polyangiaceae bacterium]HOE51635.1 metallophosphoesterase [Polyangiaceae bacterium]